jgi:signal transduction histidine kinase
VEIQEETFTHISRELHDNIGQVLSLVSINLNTLNLPSETAKITMMDDLLTKAMADLRNLSHSLDADYIRVNGWTEPVRKLLLHLQNTGKYSTDIIIEEDLPDIGSDRPIILFRMIQEVINNITKHARADKIFFEAKNQNNDLVILVRDNGKGFDTKHASAGSGLRNLENRSKMINGNIIFDSEPGNGTTVTISIKSQ